VSIIFRCAARSPFYKLKGSWMPADGNPTEIGPVPTRFCPSQRNSELLTAFFFCSHICKRVASLRVRVVHLRQCWVGRRCQWRTLFLTLLSFFRHGKRALSKTLCGRVYMRTLKINLPDHNIALPPLLVGYLACITRLLPDCLPILKNKETGH
jgi:hypothetical protein